MCPCWWCGGCVYGVGGVCCAVYGVGGVDVVGCVGGAVDVVVDDVVVCVVSADVDSGVADERVDYFDGDVGRMWVGVGNVDGVVGCVVDACGVRVAGIVGIMVILVVVVVAVVMMLV